MCAQHRTDPGIVHIVSLLGGIVGPGQIYPNKACSGYAQVCLTARQLPFGLATYVVTIRRGGLNGKTLLSPTVPSRRSPAEPSAAEHQLGVVDRVDNELNLKLPGDLTDHGFHHRYFFIFGVDGLQRPGRVH